MTTTALTPKKIFNWLIVIIIILTAAALILVSIFLYRNFCQTISQSEEILVLKERVSLNTVNMEKFNSIIDKLTKKTAVKKSANVTDPFN